MNAQQIYIAMAIVALAIIAGLMFFVKKGNHQYKLSPFAALAFAFVLAGIVFGESRLVGYGLMGIGVLLAVIDMVQKMRKK
ncbi:MAG: hypothetical protein WC445_04080 [Patescibacteria group bacterium]